MQTSIGEIQRDLGWALACHNKFSHYIVSRRRRNCYFTDFFLEHPWAPPASNQCHEFHTRMFDDRSPCQSPGVWLSPLRRRTDQSPPPPPLLLLRWLTNDGKPMLNPQQSPGSIPATPLDGRPPTRFHAIACAKHEHRTEYSKSGRVPACQECSWSRTCTEDVVTSYSTPDCTQAGVDWLTAMFQWEFLAVVFSGLHRGTVFMCPWHTDAIPLDINHNGHLGEFRIHNECQQPPQERPLSPLLLLARHQPVHLRQSRRSGSTLCTVCANRPTCRWWLCPFVTATCESAEQRPPSTTRAFHQHRALGAQGRPHPWKVSSLQLVFVEF